MGGGAGLANGDDNGGYVASNVDGPQFSAVANGCFVGCVGSSGRSS